MRQKLIEYATARDTTDPNAPASAAAPKNAGSSMFAGQDMSAILGIALPPPAPQTVAEELASYLATRPDSNVSPLEWWSVNTHYYPRLATVARDVLAIPGMF
jgi:hypothetical protein